MIISAGMLSMFCASPSSVRGDTAGPVPVIHVTDLYRPHIDPDDHWDLACVYALAHRGDIDLRAVLIDYPPAGRDGHDPDIAAVAQMNRVTGLAVPVAVGSPTPMKSPEETQFDADAAAHQGVRLILDTLRTAKRPVVINVTGSSRDIAVAGRKAPDLFAEKCAVIYLNAGMGSPGGKPTKIEYNVTLGRAAYAAIFDLPCPVYWMPCFEGTESEGGPLVREYATHYRFRQRDILPHLSNQARNYFAFMFGRYEDSSWLAYLQQTPDAELLNAQGAKDRHMWCTAGFLHAAGYVVAPDGRIWPRDVATERSVFSFDPIEVSCTPDGLTRWSPDPSSTNRFIFHVRDRKSYEAAMTKAMRSLLETLP
jgi:hypothetical protein